MRPDEFTDRSASFPEEEQQDWEEILDQELEQILHPEEMDSAPQADVFPEKDGDGPGHFLKEEPKASPLPEKMQRLVQLLTGGGDAEDWDDEEGGFHFPKYKAILVGLCAAVLLVLAGVISLLCVGMKSDPYDNRILNNVAVGGLNLGGMTRSEATSALNAAMGKTFSSTDMVIYFPEGTLTLSPKDTGAKLDVNAAVSAAYDYGRTGTAEQQQAAYQNSFTSAHSIGLLPFLNLDQDYIRQQIEGYTQELGGQFVQSSYALEGEAPALDAEHFDAAAPCQTLVLHTGVPGKGIDANELLREVLDAYSFHSFSVTVKSLDIARNPDPLDAEAIYKELYQAPVNSELNTTTFEASKCVYGYDFDLEYAKTVLSTAPVGIELRIPMRYITPEVTDAGDLYKDVLGRCQTPHSSNANRNHNLSLACKALDQQILMPGDTISYNKLLGERTAARGYKEAPAYSGTELVDSLGGGICQVSSTLYCASLLADLEIVERSNHGFLSSYIDPGMDATVSWGSPDLKIKNTFSFPVKISATYTDSHVIIEILGTESRDYYVEMSYEMTTSPRNVIYETHGPDSGYTDGQVLEEGTDGYVVTTYKNRYNRQTGALIAKDYCARSRYMSINKVVVKIEGEPTVPTTQATTPPETTVPPESTQPTETAVPPETTQPAETTAPTEAAQPTETTSAAPLSDAPGASADAAEPSASGDTEGAG